MLGRLKIFGKTKGQSFTLLSRQLLEFSQAFSTITDISQLVPTLVGKIQELIGVSEGALFLKGRRDSRFELVHHRGIELNPKLRLRGSYHFESEDKIIRWLLTNRIPFVMSAMPNVFNFFPEEERDILRFINSELCIGLEAHNRFIGLLCLGRRSDGRDFEETDIQLLVTIAAQAALAFENSRLTIDAIEQMRAVQELEIAGELQRRLLPVAAPAGYDNIDISGLCIPSTEVGGDYYDYFPISDKELGVIVGDVAGHGMSAGFLMGMARSCVSTTIKIDPSVDRVMSTLNSVICDIHESQAMMTCIYGIYNMEESTLTYANAGHLYPMHYDAAKGVITTVESTSYPMGVRYDVKFPVRTIKLKPGDFVLGCSDGYIEARNRLGEVFGFDRFEETVFKYRDKSAGDMVHAIKRELFKFLSGQPNQDDLTLLVIKSKG